VIKVVKKSLITQCEPEVLVSFAIKSEA